MTTKEGDADGVKFREKASLVVVLAPLGNALILVTLTGRGLPAAAFTATDGFRVAGQFGRQLFHDLRSVSRMVPRFVWILLVVVELVLGRTELLARVSPLDQPVALGADGSTQGFTRVGMKGMITNTGR